MVLLQAAIQTPLGRTQGTASVHDTGDSMILVAVLLCTLLRGVRMQESKIAAIALLTQAATHCDDDARLQRIVPHLLVCAFMLVALHVSSSYTFQHS